VNQTRGEITYGGSRIAFAVRHADRRTLEIAVHPDGAVDVVAPLGVVYGDIHERVVRRARWISAQRAYFAQFDPRTPARGFVSGETHLYLGRRYRLAITSGAADSVKLVGGRFVITIGGSVTPARVETMLRAWYRERAAARLGERMALCWARFACHRLDMPRIRILRMRARWGSLSPGGVLSLNVDLVRAPRDCIDYVIVHELCHLEYPDHGAGFHARLEQVLPDWEKRKHRLELALS
jgi:predicted metal-dependent hydrolase